MKRPNDTEQLGRDQRKRKPMQRFWQWSREDAKTSELLKSLEIADTFLKFYWYIAYRNISFFREVCLIKQERYLVLKIPLASFWKVGLTLERTGLACGRDGHVLKHHRQSSSSQSSSSSSSSSSCEKMFMLNITTIIIQRDMFGILSDFQIGL